MNTTTHPGADHRVSALYTTREEAMRVQARLVGLGFSADRIEILQDMPTPSATEGSDEILKHMVVDGAIGTAVGTGVGAVGTALLWAANITLFVASPLIAPLAMLGWFASVGGIVGAVAGTASKEGRFSELVMDAIKSGSVVLVVHTQGETERTKASTEISQSLLGQGQAALSQPA